MGEINSMSMTDLAVLLGSARAPVVVDVCMDEDHALNPHVIPGARRMSFTAAAQDSGLAQDHPVLVVCQKGLKLSQGVAAALRARGREAWYLVDGMAGWTDAGLPLVPSALDPLIGQHGRAWAVPSVPDAQALLESWIVKRFSDPAAIWWRVESGQLDPVAQRFDIGTLGLAGRIAASIDALETRFMRMSQMTATPPIRSLLDAFGATGDTESEAIFPALDALWAMTERKTA